MRSTAERGSLRSAHCDVEASPLLLLLLPGVVVVVVVGATSVSDDSFDVDFDDDSAGLLSEGCSGGTQP